MQYRMQEVWHSSIRLWSATVLFNESMKGGLHAVKTADSKTCSSLVMSDILIRQ